MGKEHFSEFIKVWAMKKYTEKLSHLDLGFSQSTELFFQAWLNI